MAESAVLRRSFSNPSEISFQEGDPLRALGESISFGRYMSESLAWEKWSTFSPNRYLEEAEKYSKPGSVAKMKAHFEAHYKRIGAKKQAAQEQANDVPSGVEPKVQDNVEDTSSLNIEEAEAISHSSVHGFPAQDTPDEELLQSVVVSSSGSSTDIKKLQNEEINVLETGVTLDASEDLVEPQLNQCKDPEVTINVSDSTFKIKENEYSVAPGCDIVVSTPKRKAPFKEMEKENLESKSKQKSAFSSLRKSTKSNMSKLSSSLARFASPIPKKESIGTPKSRKAAKEPLNEKKPAPKLLHMSTDSDVKLSSSLARLATPIRTKKESSGIPRNRKSTEEPPEEKKLAQKLLHMSINLDANPIKKASQASHKARMGKVFTPLGKIIRDSFASSPAPSRASVSSVSRHTSATPHTESKRSRIALEKSFDKSRKLEQKLQSPYVGTKSSEQSLAPTIFSSFNFRTEERAAKRREFFQNKMEKEADKMHLLNKAKIPPRRTESPKRRSKPASDLAPSAFSRPPKRNIGSKLGAEKTQPIPTQSSIPLTKKKRHENASPNIL